MAQTKLLPVEVPTEDYERPLTKRQFSGFKPTYEKVNPLSQTVPDMTMSLQQMVQRVKQGLPINGSATQPVWNGQKLLPVWKDLDLIDRAAIVKQATENMEKIKARRDALALEKNRKDEEARKEFERVAAEQREAEIAAYVAKQKQTGA